MKHIFIRRRLFTLTMLVSLAIFLPVGQAFAQNMQQPAPEGSVPVDPKDPWENWNRKVYTFNETIDRWFLKPVAQAYRTFTPQIVDRGITNFFNNLTESPELHQQCAAVERGVCGGGCRPLYLQHHLRPGRSD